MKNILLTILLASTIWSCGSRKVNKSKTEEKAASEVSVKIESAEKSVVNIQNDVVQETKKEVENNISKIEENLEPIDPSKPIEKTETKEGNTVKITWKNAKVNNKSIAGNSRSKTNETVKDNSTFSEKKDDKVKSEINNKKAESKLGESRITDAKRGFNWWWLILLIPIMLIVKYRRSIASKFI